VTDEDNNQVDPDNPGYNVDIKDYVDQRINDLKELIDSRFEALALNLTVAKTEIDRRLAEMNELRAQILEERGAYPTKDAVDHRIATLETRLGRLESGATARPELDRRS